MTATSDPVAISILIRTFNSGKTLDRVLSGLALKSGEEYIVVDSGSADSTLAIAESHGARIVHAPGPFNYSKSLNLGFQVSRNPWVLVISSHSISVVPDLLALYRAAARNFSPNLAAAYGPNSLDGHSPFDDDAIRFYSPENYMDVYSFCGNGNTLYRRSAWEAVPFNEGIRTGEDKDWLTEIVKKDYHIAFVSSARTINLTQYSLRYMFKKGYSDCLAWPDKSPSIFSYFMALASHTKKFLLGGMPVGNWIRYSAHIAGRFCASYRSHDNTPGK
jgi:glycosyltransferase involved in cell wall biosynthesis